MSLYWFVLPAVLLVASVLLSIVLVRRGMTVKKALGVQLISLVGIIVVGLVLSLVAAAAGDPTTASTAATAASDAANTATAAAKSGFAYVGAALAVGLAGIGGGIAVANAAPAAIGAMAEDPKTFGKSIIFVALGEGFGLYGLLIGIMCLVL